MFFFDVSYFVHQYRCGRGQRDEVGGEEGEVEAGGVEELEWGGEEEIEDDLGQDEGQQHGGLVQRCPVHWHHLSSLKYPTEIYNFDVQILIILLFTWTSSNYLRVK